VDTYPGILLGESYNNIHALADFIHDVAKYQQVLAGTERATATSFVARFWSNPSIPTAGKFLKGIPSSYSFDFSTSCIL